MASTPTIAILILLLVAGLIHAGSEKDQGVIVHEGMIVLIRVLFFLLIFL